MCLAQAAVARAATDCVKPPDVGESHYLLGCTRDDGQHACSKYSLIFPKDKINVDSTPEYLNARLCRAIFTR